MKKFLVASTFVVLICLGFNSCKAKKVDCPAYGRQPVSSSQQAS